ncbi:MAG: hypothetical protein NZ873_02425 [Crenarchaeota archaeon]|nr:hypothetical protein [Thermoproteota archaeon]MDW8034457.1 hypothetical protein [Nitrososphaerota archaeon]
MSSSNILARLITNDAKLIRKAFKAVSSLIDEAPLKISEEGFFIRTLDLAEVSMIDMVLSKEAFEIFEFNKPIKANIRLSDVLNLLKFESKSEKLEMIFREDKVTFRVSNEFTRIFTVPIFFSEDKDLPLPKVSLGNSFETKVSMIKHLLESGKHVSDYISISVEKNTVLLSAKGEISEYQVVLTVDDGSLINPVLKEASKASYDLKRLSSIVSSLLFSENVKVEFDTDMPLKISQKVEDVPNSIVTFYIAPRMEKT